jgi:hypothetical protein
MTVQQHGVIDFVAHDPAEDTVILVMVEDRDWGDSGMLLPDLQEKMNTYFNYATSGQLAREYPSMAGKQVEIQLRSAIRPGPRELDFIRIVTSKHLRPAGIQFLWKVIGDEGSGFKSLTLVDQNKKGSM